MSKNREISLISRAIMGISLMLVALLFSALILTACNNSDASLIGEEKAKEIAISHAGVAQESVSRYRLERDRDGRRNVYEIEFWSEKTEYDYEIDAQTGEILKFEKDIK